MALESHSIEIQQKRFEKGNPHSEIKILNSLPDLQIFPRKAPFGLIIRIIFKPGLLCDKEVHFDLYLEGKYPFQSPKLFCETVFSFPSASDGRDLIEELLKTRWSPSITCADIVTSIPKFFPSFLKAQDELFCRNYGKFHLGSPYLLDLWHKKDSMGSFFCTENDLSHFRHIKERLIVVTHTLILIFELNTQVIDVGFLISWATLQSLNSIKRAVSEPDRLTFDWKSIGENQAYSQQFKVHQAGELIDLIAKNMKKINGLSRKKEEQKVFKEEEVTGKIIKNMKIGEVLEEINMIERHLDKNLSIKIVNHLMELYQHVIEYFTAFGDLQFQVYLKKMHELLGNERVSALLQNKPEQEEVKQGDGGKNIEPEKKVEQEVRTLEKEEFEKRNDEISSLEEPVNNPERAIRDNEKFDLKGNTESHSIELGGPITQPEHVATQIEDSIGLNLIKQPEHPTEESEHPVKSPESPEKLQDSPVKDENTSQFSGSPLRNEESLKKPDLKEMFEIGDI